MNKATQQLIIAKDGQCGVLMQFSTFVWFKDICHHKMFKIATQDARSIFYSTGHCYDVI